MKMFSALNFEAAFFLLAVTVTPAHPGPPTATITARPEILPDGNVRDPMPSPEELREFLATTKQNMVFFKAGTFEMGDWGSEVNENGLPFDGSRDSKPLHKVTLSDFYIGKYPVTYAEFDMFTAFRRLPRINQSDYMASYRKADNPAGVTWDGAKDYCRWLGQLTQLRFDLPTEAQWEYAARSGGKRHVYPTDNGAAEEGRNLPSFEQRQAAGGLVAVSSFPPNQAGVYYMSAGVHEFTNDWYDPKYYETSPTLNPTGPDSGIVHVVRGFHGSAYSAMTFKRWGTKHRDLTGAWTRYGMAGAEGDRVIPYTKYSNYPDNAFRCVLNQPIK